MSETEKKPTDAEEIFTEFQKTKESSKESEQTPEPQTESPPEPQTESPPEPQTESPPEPQTESPPEPQTESPPEPESEQTVEDTKVQVTQEEPKTETHAENVAKTEVTSARSERNVVYVGMKPLMTYVTATLTQLAILPTVTIKARGKKITHAVDVSQMIVKRMSTAGFLVSDVRISSDSLTSQDGKLRKVSTIEIDISKT
ncbi:MAG: DNA-binding protein [Thaumarchaeota archaeon]|nr:DNA-binding protein [Nitrososphaerota archaeon]